MMSYQVSKIKVLYSVDKPKTKNDNYIIQLHEKLFKQISHFLMPNPHAIHVTVSTWECLFTSHTRDFIIRQQKQGTSGSGGLFAIRFRQDVFSKKDLILGTLPYDIPVPPCRSLCELVMDECADRINEFGIELPVEFTCSRFPELESGHPCVPIQTHLEELPPGTLRWTVEETVGEVIQREMQCPLDQRYVF